MPHLCRIAAFCALLSLPALAQIDPRVETAIVTETPINGVSTTPDGRVFLLYARVDGSTGPTIVEQVGNTTEAYPDLEWNSYSSTKDPATHFVRINSQRIGPDGHLCAVDVGSPASGEPVILPEGPKLVVIDINTNQVSKTYLMGNVTLANSLLDDIRFNPTTNKAYLTDAGVPALIVLDLATGEARRFLEDDISTRGSMPISAEGRLLHSPDGIFQFIYADQLEVSPDAGGTAIDAQGNIYVSSIDRQEIIKITSDGTKSVFIHDERLLWVDAMWVDSQQKLWMPAAQLNRGTPFNNGTSFVQKPLYVFAIDIGIGPSPVDHA
ncbi:hypothetical protein Q7P35_005270 [Cladosporium inversicolor]